MNVQNNSRRILVGTGQIACLAIIVFLAGCSDAEKRAAGRNLQDATAKARRLYAKANSILSNPRLVDGQGGKTVVTESLSPDALKALDRAEKELTAALKENYEGQKGDADSVPQADVALAKMTLGMVRNLRSQYYIWSAGKALKMAAGSLHKSLGGLSAIEQADGVVFSLQQRVKNARKSIKDLDAQAGAIRQDKAQAVSQKDKFDTNTKRLETEIAQLEELIKADSLKAGSLKKESSLSTGPDSLRKLEAALKIEERIHANRFKIRGIEGKIERLKGELDYCKYQIAQADYKLSLIDKKRGSWEQSASKDGELLRKKIAQVESLLKTVADSQAMAGKACRKAIRMAQKAEDALKKALKDFAQAAKLQSDRKAVIIAESGESNTLAATLQMTLWDMNRRVGRFARRAEALWGQLHVDKPSESLAQALRDFQDKTKDSGARAITDSKAAVLLKRQAVKASPHSRRWYFQRDLAGAYIKYAQALQAGGKGREAEKVIGEATRLLVEIQRQATKAKEYPSILKLKNLIETAAGEKS